MRVEAETDAMLARIMGVKLRDARRAGRRGGRDRRDRAPRTASALAGSADRICGRGSGAMARRHMFANRRVYVHTRESEQPSLRRRRAAAADAMADGTPRPPAGPRDTLVMPATHY